MVSTCGVTFSNAYVTSAVCAPSRAGILTGRHQDRFGFRRLPTLDPLAPLAGLPHDEETLGELLKRAGYATGYVGKWHLGTHASHHPLRRGFDRFFGFLSGGHRYETAELTIPDLFAVRSPGEWYYTRLWDDDAKVVDYRHTYVTDELTDAAVGFVEARVHDPRPFLLFVSHLEPHKPRRASADALREYASLPAIPACTHERCRENRQVYAACITTMDGGIGRVLAALVPARRRGCVFGAGVVEGVCNVIRIRTGVVHPGAGERGVAVGRARIWPNNAQRGRVRGVPLV